ncbi:MAG: hypothetical protein Q9169_002332 [Polycauliona sp. 2 TL-2023]
MFSPRRRSTVLALALCVAFALWYFNSVQPTLQYVTPSLSGQDSSKQPQVPSEDISAPKPPPKTPIEDHGVAEPAPPSAPDPPSGPIPPFKPTPPTELRPGARKSENYPVQSLVPLPTGTPAKISKIQHVFSAGTLQEEAERRERLAAVKQSFVHSWEGYKKHAWKEDELLPIKGGYTTTFGGWGATLVDSLDSLWMMGLKDEFENAVKAVKEMDFSVPRVEELNVFETTIRYLGGFLGAYDLSGGQYPVLLTKAKEVGDFLLGAFDTPNRMPVTRWKWEEWRKGAAQEAGPGVLVAEVGSLCLEFTRLAQLTGEPKFYDVIQRIADVFDRNQNRTALPGLWPVIMDTQHRQFADVGFTLGGMADSTYEYLPKQHILLGGLTQQYKNMYEATLAPIMKHIFFRPMTPDNADILISSGVRIDGAAEKIVPDYEGQHLGCFTGGMIGIGAKIFDRPEDVNTARRLVDGCIWAYNHTQTGIMPEIFSMVPCLDRECKWDEGRWLKSVGVKSHRFEGIPEGLSDEEKGRWIAREDRIPQGFSSIKDRKYILRPEAIESVFIFYRMTGEKKYQDAAWRMFTTIENYTRTYIANSGIHDVTAENPTKDDRMESFWLAETLKYFYAIFADPDVLNLDAYVL